MKHPNYPFLAFVGICLSLAWVSASSQGKMKGCLDCEPEAGCPVVGAAAVASGLKVSAESLIELH